MIGSTVQDPMLTGFGIPSQQRIRCSRAAALEAKLKFQPQYVCCCHSFGVKLPFVFWEQQPVYFKWV
jgi:hypothetical protein